MSIGAPMNTQKILQQPEPVAAAQSLFASPRARALTARVEYLIRLCSHAEMASLRVLPNAAERLIEAVSIFHASAHKAREEYLAAATKAKFSTAVAPPPENSPATRTYLQAFFEEIAAFDALMVSEHDAGTDKVPNPVLRASYTYNKTITRAVNRLVSAAQAIRTEANRTRGSNTVQFPVKKEGLHKRPSRALLKR